jgi:hypothetical protein
MKTHCSGNELQIGMNTKTWGKFDGDNNTMETKQKTLSFDFLTWWRPKCNRNLQQRWRIKTQAWGDDDANKMQGGGKLCGHNVATQKWNLKHKCRKLGDNGTTKTWKQKH